MTALRITRLLTTAPDFDARLQQALHWSSETDRAIEDAAAAIVADVRERGDAAVLQYTARFDGLEASAVAALEVPRSEWQRAFDGLPSATTSTRCARRARAGRCATNMVRCSGKR
jgi:histidinol dehydrogenase